MGLGIEMMGFDRNYINWNVFFHNLMDDLSLKFINQNHF